MKELKYKIGDEVCHIIDGRICSGMVTKIKLHDGKPLGWGEIPIETPYVDNYAKEYRYIIYPYTFWKNEQNVFDNEKALINLL